MSEMNPDHTFPLLVCFFVWYVQDYRNEEQFCVVYFVVTVTRIVLRYVSSLKSDSDVYFILPTPLPVQHASLMNYTFFAQSA
jgi:hypothetical protein